MRCFNWTNGNFLNQSTIVLQLLQPEVKKSNMAGKETCQIAFDGNFELLKLKLKENHDLASSIDEVIDITYLL